MKSAILGATLAFLALSGKAPAHEFWIDPEEFIIAPGQELVAHLRVGQEFSGSSMSYLPRNFETFTVLTDGAIREVEGRFGDVPALRMADMAEGLAVIVHQTSINDLTWSEWARFLNFALHKDLGDVTAMHAARGLSQEDVREEYFRYAKSLVAVGEGQGADQRVGLRAELVALANPYTSGFSGVMELELWYDGEVQPDYQVELFAEDAQGNIEITLHRTNADGVVTLPVSTGVNYMADAVFLEAVEPQVDGDAIWVTHWANMTFTVPN